MAVLTSCLLLNAAESGSLTTPRGDHVDTLHGVVVADPYRWLEATDAPAATRWVRRQQKQARTYLDALPQRARFHDTLTALWDHPRQGLPTPTRSGAQLFEANDGLQEQPVLHIRDGARGQARILLDPNALRGAAGTPLSLTDYALSPDGRLLAYLISESGSDWNTLRVRRVADGTDLDLAIDRVKFSDLAWTIDSAGLFYSRYPEANDATGGMERLAHQQLRFHRLGSDPDTDLVIRADPEHPQRGFSGEVSDDGRWLFITTWKGTRHNLLHVQPLHTDGRSALLDGAPIMLVEDFHADYAVIGSRGDTLFLRSNAEAPNGRILAVDLKRPAARHWRVIVPESRDVIRSAHHIGGRIVLHALRDVTSVLRVVDERGVEADAIDLPGLGAVTQLRGRPDAPTVYYGFTAASRPTSNYAHNLESGSRELLHAPDIAFVSAAYVTRRGFATSRDGTRIPVLVTHRRGIDKDGSHPTVLYGYGGFNIALTPRFSVAAAAWLQAGGIWAVANLRGGGEYGTAWHEAGIRDNKRNTFDDAIAAAGWLIHQGYTAPAHLALHGASNGGMMVGAVVNRRPDLFAAAVPSVGVMDMLRFHRFTIGWAWTSDYGDPEDPDDFRTLLGYSPYHNITPGTAYPATLVVTADHDDRVAPAHSYKYAARLQHAQRSDAPILLRVQTKAGHGAGKGTATRIEEWTDILAFIAAHTGLDPS